VVNSLYDKRLKTVYCIYKLVVHPLITLFRLPLHFSIMYTASALYLELLRLSVCSVVMMSIEVCVYMKIVDLMRE
jgi:hypothetical protein